jgi:hypothetical protein
MTVLQKENRVQFPEKVRRFNMKVMGQMEKLKGILKHLYSKCRLHCQNSENMSRLVTFPFVFPHVTVGIALVS